MKMQFEVNIAIVLYLYAKKDSNSIYTLRADETSQKKSLTSPYGWTFDNTVHAHVCVCVYK